MSVQTQILESSSITQRRIFLFWLPLAASWLLMGMEMPFVNALLARLAESEQMIAAFGIVGSLSITVESPVIMLLATSTALARSAQNYRTLQRFTHHLMWLTTLVHALLSFTPLFDVVVRGWMGVPPTLLQPIRLGMQLMLPWSAAIAWRRFKQGVLIRYGQTRFVGQGTIVRLITSAGLAALLALASRVWQFPGIIVGTVALSIGVCVEAAYAHWVARRLIREKFSAPLSTEPELTYAALVKFHAPLAASTLLFLLTQPMVSAALARLPNPQLVLAAWPVASGLLFITRAPVLALPEVIIALLVEGEQAQHALRQFALTLGVVCSGVVAAFGFTPLGHFYFREVMGVSATLAALTQAGIQVAVLLPALMAAQSWFRGLLTAHKATSFITASMLINLLVMAAALAAGVYLQAPGVLLAALALTLATSAETAGLWWAAIRGVRSSTSLLESSIENQATE